LSFRLLRAAPPLLGGHIKIYFSLVPTVLQHIRAGTLRALAVSTDSAAAQKCLRRVRATSISNVYDQVVINAARKFDSLAGLPGERTRAQLHECRSIIRFGPFRADPIAAFGDCAPDTYVDG